MSDRISEFFSSNYMPHGMCYLWKPELLWLNVGSDAAIAISYFTIPVGIYYFMKKRKDLEFKWVFLLFSLFISFCGITHVIGIYVVWNGAYGIHGISKFFTAVVSAATAFYLFRSIPLALKLPSPQQLSKALESAQQERGQRVQSELAIERDIALRESTEGAHVGIAVVDSQGIIKIANKALNHMFKYDSGALEGMNINVLLPKHLVEEHEKLIHAFIQSDHLDVDMAAGRNLEGVAYTGEKIPIEVRLHKGVDKRQPVIYASISDLTERNKIRQLLIESNERFARITESAEEGLWEINFNEGTLWLSTNVFNFPQSQPEDGEAYFERWLENVEEAFRPEVRDYFYGREDEEKSEPLVFPLLAQDGVHRWHVARAGNVFKKGARLYRSGTLLDIHERRNLENLLRKEEALNQSIISQMPIGLHMYAMNDVGELVFQRYNDAAESILGFDHKPLVGKTIIEAFPALKDTGLVQKCYDVAEKGVYFENEDIVYKDAKIEGVFSANYFPASNGTLISLFQDVSERRKAEIALRKQERFISRAMNATFAGIYIYDIESGNNEFINDAYTRILGYTEDDLKLVPASEFIELFHPEDVDLVQAHMASVLGSKSESEVFKVEYRFRHKQGHWVWCLSHDTVFEFGSSGTVSKFVGSFIDITQRKKMEIALRATLKKLEASNEELEQFAYIASHDLKEPLRTLRTFTDFLIKDVEAGNTKRAEEDRRFIVGACDRMSSLIEDLLELSKAGYSEYHFENIDLNVLLQDVLNALKTRIEESNATIEIEESLPTIEVDKSKFSQVLQNLIQNALKFHKPNQAPWVKISALKGPSQVEITVTDNGIGIPEGCQKAIFEIFRKLHDSADYAGTGIGLAIVNKIIDRHSGYVTVKSKEDEGTSFILHLPLKRS